ncbi:uncharacterized protein LOC143880095 [Tasmannia lanceolata]|uniref:uncharacterized protein LOC143880095 n=1 Tax=Tasmannia lanceolata TaxID=3420 RepID=UPI004062BD79
MASGLESVPVHTQKHDPAWKHCQIIKNGDRNQLKCLYCGKIFSGGGIHRIKEHLAGQKGNAASCSRVPTDVRRNMQQSLDGVVVRKKKKQKLAEEIKSLNPTLNDLDAFASQCEMDTGLQLLALPDALESNSGLLAIKDGGAKSSDKKKRGRKKNSSPTFLISDTNVVSKFDSGWMKGKDQVHMAIGRFLYHAGVPLDAVNSVYFQPMVDAIASVGPGLETPSYHDFRGWILRNSVEEVNSVLEQYRGMWGRTGCSVMADEWTNGTGKTLINFLVYCPEGKMFLKSIDATDIVLSVDALYELLREVVGEVGVRNVVQIITNNSENYVVVGKRLTETFPSMFWTPCAARCVNLILEDFGKLEWINIVFSRAQSVARFIYNHGIILNMMRKYTGGKELLEPSSTRIATDFITLRSMVNQKDNLRAMFTSQEWMGCPYSKTPVGVELTELICCPSFWSSCTVVVHLTEPLVRVLRMVDSEKRPAMGYIYEGMYRVKEAIKKELKKRKDYLPYWNIIDRRWNKGLHHPLYAAGFFLNPQFLYSIKGDIHNEIMSSVLDCIERLVPDTKIQDKLNIELNLYKNAAGDFGRKMAIRARNALFPADWWSTYGGGCPNLTRLAIHILSQTCSASGCNRDHISFEQIHNQRRNQIEHQRLNDLVFAQYNLRLQQSQHLKNKLSDPISIDNFEVLEDWVIKKDTLFEGEDFVWKAVDPPVAYSTQSGSSIDEPGDLVVGYEDEEIYNASEDLEEEDDGS